MSVTAPHYPIRTNAAYGPVEVAHFDFATADGLRLPLRRLVRAGAGGAADAVLLLHGASAASGTFLFGDPESDYLSSQTFRGQAVGPGLAEFLFAEGFDVWLLDWRGSNRVARRSATGENAIAHCSIDDVARFDIPQAAAQILAVRADNRGKPAAHGRLNVLGHCVGGMALAMSLGCGALQDTIGASRLGNIVLSTIGLFVRCPWDGLWKIQDRVLERLMGDPTIKPADRILDPTVAMRLLQERDRTGGTAPAFGPHWPSEFAAFFDMFPTAWLPCNHASEDTRRFCRLLAFMYGKPYAEDQLPPALHDGAFLMDQFGAIPLQLYMHAAQNARRGFAAPVDTLDVRHNDRSGEFDRVYLDLENFEDISVTIQTGAHNALWHRDSVDRMWEWLSRRKQIGRSRKMIFADYGHQDLLWGKDRIAETFPFMAHSLGRR